MNNSRHYLLPHSHEQAHLLAPNAYEPGHLAPETSPHPLVRKKYQITATPQFQNDMGFAMDPQQTQDWQKHFCCWDLNLNPKNFLNKK